MPQNLDELWAGFDPRREPLQSEILKEWEQDGVVCRVVRFQVGEFKGAPAKVAAFYVFPKGTTKIPGLLQLHGSGQSASFDGAFANAKRGYASLSRKLGPQTTLFYRPANSVSTIIGGHHYAVFNPKCPKKKPENGACRPRFARRAGACIRQAEGHRP